MIRNYLLRNNEIQLGILQNSVSSINLILKFEKFFRTIFTCFIQYKVVFLFI